MLEIRIHLDERLEAAFESVGETFAVCRTQAGLGGSAQDRHLPVVVGRP